MRGLPARALPGDERFERERRQGGRGDDDQADDLPGQELQGRAQQGIEQPRAAFPDLLHRPEARSVRDERDEPVDVRRDPFAFPDLEPAQSLAPEDVGVVEPQVDTRSTHQGWVLNGCIRRLA